MGDSGGEECGIHDWINLCWKFFKTVRVGGGWEVRKLNKGKKTYLNLSI